MDIFLPRGFEIPRKIDFREDVNGLVQHVAQQTEAANSKQIPSMLQAVWSLDGWEFSHERQDRIPFSPFCYFEKLGTRVLRYSSELLVSGGKGLSGQARKRRVFVIDSKALGKQ
jgi:hypothetical protein